MKQDTVLDIYDHTLVDTSRLLYPSTQKQLKSVLALLAGLVKEGKFIGIVDGAYDVPTENHVWSLRDCRRKLAHAYFGEAFEKASQIEKQQMIADDRLVLIVTADADERVSFKKSYKTDKGNILRPVYSWRKRANRIAGLTIPDGKGGLRFVVDYVTVDGDRAHQHTPLESHLTFGKYLVENNLMGLWLLYEWHEWFEHAQKHTEKYATMDILTRDQSSSSTIINQIKKNSAEL